MLAVGFVVEYKAVTVSIDHNLKVAKGDVIDAIDDADKNWEKRSLEEKKMWNEKMSTAATRSLRPYCRTCDASVLHKKYSLTKLYDYFANSANMKSVKDLDKHRNRVLKIKSIIRKHNGFEELKDVAAGREEIEEALR